MSARVFVPVALCLTLAVAMLVWSATSARDGHGPRVRPSRTVADAFRATLCRAPSDRETVDWDSRPFDAATLTQTLAAGDEGVRVRQIRALYAEALRRDATMQDCARIRASVDRKLAIDAAGRELASLPEARRVAQVRRLFVETYGRDPIGWDDPSLRRWVDSPFTVAEIRTRLVAQRPLVGVHYFTWYGPVGNGWGNNLNTVPADAPAPLAGRYDSSDSDVIALQIRQIEDAGFDFAIVHTAVNAPRTWSNARTFLDRLSGHRLKAVVVLDGLYEADAATKAMWVQKARTDFTGDSHYLELHGEPVVVLYSVPLDLNTPGVLLRNLYWTYRYDPGQNTFNADRRLDPRDWPFWAPTPQPLVNGMVPVIPGYTDASLGRPRTMVQPRGNGQLYREQWTRALALHPEIIAVYSWNEYFEQTAIEPTNVWGRQYLDMSACFIRLAHRGTAGAC